MELENKAEKIDEIYVLTLRDCNFCSLLRDTLLKMDVPFKQIDINKHSQLGDSIELQYQTDGYYPVVLYGDNVLLPHTNLAPQKGVRIFHTIDEALELLLKDYYEI
tara:strand:+ start:3432 stop:3749 length:318 start_codon:yes stop_codon:yes gene_type:complete